jgi:hypothetical protein
MIDQFLSNKNLIELVLTSDEILEMSRKNRGIRIMMGQTFDEGQPIEMLKYVVFIMNLSDLLSKNGVEVTANLLIADHFMTEINEDKHRDEAKRQVESRINYLSRVNRVYGGNMSFVLSSELCKTAEYQSNLERLKKKTEDDSKFRQMVLEAIPADRRKNPGAINYPLEELAVIESLRTDIKIGPKYEIKYDEPARKFASMIGFKRFSAIHLKNIYPLGNPSISEELREEIEDFGVLPYKKNSKGLRDFRIDPVNDPEDKVARLIKSTTDIRALQGLVETYKLISIKRGEKFSHVVPESIQELRGFTTNLYNEFVGKNFR